MTPLKWKEETSTATTNSTSGAGGLPQQHAVARRRIIVFCLVDPVKRVLSTNDIPAQQVERGGKMTVERAEKIRPGHKTRPVMLPMIIGGKENRRRR